MSGDGLTIGVGEQDAQIWKVECAFLPQSRASASTGEDLDDSSVYTERVCFSRSRVLNSYNFICTWRLFMFVFQAHWSNEAESGQCTSRIFISPIDMHIIARLWAAR